MPEPVEVLVLTPLPEEMTALMGLLPEPDETGVEKYGYRIWRSVPLCDEPNATLVAVMPPDMDQLPAATTVFQALRRWKPQYVAGVGIAGALHEDIMLGDVLAARYVFQWDAKRKVLGASRQTGFVDRIRSFFRSDEKTELAPIPHRVSEEAVVAAGMLLADKCLYESWQRECLNASTQPPNVPRPPILHIDDLASGSAVVDSPTYRSLVGTSSRKVRMVETETAGILTAVRGADPSIVTIMIRGASDAAAGKAQSDNVAGGVWRQYAAANACCLLLCLLRNFLPALRDGTRLSPTNETSPARQNRTETVTPAPPDRSPTVEFVESASDGQSGEEMRHSKHLEDLVSRLKCVPKGAFEFGVGTANQTTVRFTENLFIDPYPVTQQLYEGIARANPSAQVHPDHPVDSVSWADAALFCNTLSSFLGLEPAYIEADDESGILVLRKEAEGIRLPFEAEWERACGTTPTGEDALKKVAWFSETTSKPVGGLEPNEFGLYDMLGNVWEWCNDWFVSKPKVDHVDPRGPERGYEKVCRGGSWANWSNMLTSTYRFKKRPDSMVNNIGFRVVTTSNLLSRLK